MRNEQHRSRGFEFFNFWATLSCTSHQITIRSVFKLQKQICFDESPISFRKLTSWSKIADATESNFANSTSSKSNWKLVKAVNTCSSMLLCFYTSTVTKITDLFNISQTLSKFLSFHELSSDLYFPGFISHFIVVLWCSAHYAKANFHDHDDR